MCTVSLGLDLKRIFLSQRADNLIKKADRYIKKYNYCKIGNEYNMQGNAEIQYLECFSAGKNGMVMHCAIKGGPLKNFFNFLNFKVISSFKKAARNSTNNSCISFMQFPTSVTILPYLLCHFSLHINIHIFLNCL